MARPKGAIMGPDGKLLRDASGNPILKGSPEAAALGMQDAPEAPQEGDEDMSDEGTSASTAVTSATAAHIGATPASGDGSPEYVAPLGQNQLTGDRGFGDPAPRDFMGNGLSLEGGLTGVLARATKTEADPARHAALSRVEMALGDLKAQVTMVDHEFDGATEAVIELLRGLL